MFQKQPLIYVAVLLFCLVIAIAAETDAHRNIFARSPQNSDPTPNKNNAKQQDKDKAKAQETKPSKNDTKDENTDQDAGPVKKDEPAGRLIMEQPSLTMGEVPRYAIGSNITFKWKYDEYLHIAPRYLAFEITRDRRQYVTIANISYQPTTFTWETSKWNDQDQNYLLTEERYYLFISDERGRDGNGTSSNGRLSPYSSTYFYLYNPGSGICVACLESAAPSLRRNSKSSMVGDLSFEAIQHLLLPTIITLAAIAVTWC
ncbi:hypothetical protein BDF19DRAFT_425058 [Syncephalis fuscata]|nr:hypothetical protein BDF19DRAFT_425058 [Syncephalis fuscata]